MRHSPSPRSEFLSNGTEVFIADYEDDKGRHETKCATSAQAKLMKEERDLRSNPHISLAGYLLHRARYFKWGASHHTDKLAILSLKAVAAVAPDILLVDVTATTIRILCANLETPPTGSGAAKRSPHTIRNDIYAVSRAMDVAVVEGRILSNPARTYLASARNRIPQTMARPDTPYNVRFEVFRELLSPHASRAFELVTRAGLSYPEVTCMRPEFIDPDAGCLSVGLHWKRDNTIGLPKGLEPRIVRGLEPEWLKWLLDAPRFEGDDGFLLQVVGRGGKPIARRQMRARLAKEINEAQLKAGLVSMKTGRPYPGKHLRGFHTIGLLERYPNQLLTVAEMSGHSNIQYFLSKWSEFISDVDSHEQIEITVETIEALSKIRSAKPERSVILDMWLKLNPSH